VGGAGCLELSGPAAALVFTLNVLAVAALALIAAAWAAGI
jgi:hypothetical protein